MLLVLFWFAFAIAVGMFASIRRNRNGLGWFVLAIFISPLLAGIFVAILREADTITIEAPREDELSAAEQARLIKLRSDLAGRA